MALMFKQTLELWYMNKIGVLNLRATIDSYDSKQNRVIQLKTNQSAMYAGGSSL